MTLLEILMWMAGATFAILFCDVLLTALIDAAIVFLRHFNKEDRSD